MDLTSQVVSDIQSESDLSFSGDVTFVGTTTLDGDVVVNGSVSFLGEVGGIEINELVDVDTVSSAPLLDQVLMWTSNERWEPQRFGDWWCCR